MEKNVFYLKGIPDFTWVTDHRAIEGIVAKGFHELVNPRHVRLREQMAGFQFHVVWMQGSKMQVPDALSRVPTKTQDVIPIGAAVRRIMVWSVKEMDNGSEHLARMFKAAEGEDYQKIIKAFEDEAVIKNLHSSHPAKSVISIWDTLSLMRTDKGDLLLIDNDKILVPEGAREDLIRALHGAHSGADKMHHTAKSKYWWPDMKMNLRDHAENCLTCLKVKPQRKREEPVTSRLLLDLIHPMDELGTDVWSDRKTKHLVIIDRASGYIF